jgi:hypothetical protein
MERVRENYNWQVQNLRDIRLHGSNQVTAVRDQYYDQVIIIQYINSDNPLLLMITHLDGPN